MTQTLHITSKSEFDTLLKDFGGVVIADFYADWCGPCKMLAPVMEELANENDTSKVKIIKINVDQAQDLAGEYGIMSIPTVFFGVNNEIKEGFMGTHPKSFYEEKIEYYLKEIKNSET